MAKSPAKESEMKATGQSSDSQGKIVGLAKVRTPSTFLRLIVFSASSDFPSPH